MQLESEIENALINQLTQESGQWTYRKDINNEDALWANLRRHLNRLNLDKLEGIELTDNEMDQVKSFIWDVSASTYKAALWLSGEHGLAQIPVVRSDASLGTVYLNAVNNREFAGGSTSYEVINQYRAMALEGDGYSDRRLDVTLLINGLPLIHIELKNRAHPYLDAFRQIEKYVVEGKFRGLLGLVQMFVVSNGEQSRYIAADIQGNNCYMNKNFLTGWVDKNNQSVEECLAFAKEILNIPVAHQMIGKYSVLDNDRKKLILLRPYQIHAIEAIRRAILDHQSGFIWHTTGSGKTLTSYNVTKNLLDVPTLDKTIFLIDRKDLDQQTAMAFLSYAKNDSLDIRDTNNTHDLERKLKSADRCAIITTIQKLQKLINSLVYSSDAKVQAAAKTIASKKVAFIVDECHRAVTPETKRELEKFFSGSLWYGFTGTPIFADNARKVKGDLARTTAELFDSVDGKALHSYTIKEAIHDKAVLGFSIKGLGFRRETLEDVASQLGMEHYESMQDALLEKKVLALYAKKTGKSLYQDDRHRLDVIDYIVHHCIKKLRLDANLGESYVGLLTVESIAEAQRYYQLIKQFVSEQLASDDMHNKELAPYKKDRGIGLSRIQAMQPGFPKIAITYTVGENEDGALANHQLMQESLRDYNQMFGTSWDLSTIAGYNTDLNERLARKRARYLNRDEQLDLVIVVDRLLTGFDAPCLSTIFLDRPPMKPQHLVQAFSRTNRLFDKHKHWGYVVTLQSPELYAQKIDEALALYSQGNTSDVQVPTFEESSQVLIKAVSSFKDIVPSVEAMQEIHQAGDLKQLKEVAKAYQVLDKALGSIQVYDEFVSEELSSTFGITQEEFESFTGVYKNIIELIKSLREDEEELEYIDVEYELSSITSMEVNYQYLVSLIQSMIPEEEDDTLGESMLARSISLDKDTKMRALIDRFSKHNKGVGDLMAALWTELVFDPSKFSGQSAAQLLNERARDITQEKINAFARQWHLNSTDLRFYIQKASFIEDEQDLPVPPIAKENFDEYKSHNGSLSFLKYKSAIKKALPELIEEIRPLYRV